MVDKESTPQTCPHCQHQNPAEALKCAWCGGPLNTASTTVYIPNLAYPETRSQPRPPAGLTSEGLALYIAGEVQPVMIRGQDVLILGRTLSDDGVTAVIDLTPYNGGMLGVSRRHARLMREGDTFVLEDLSSTNGTWLNERRLPPRTQFVLRNGDQIRLGQLIMFVYFAAEFRPGHSEGDQPAQVGQG